MDEVEVARFVAWKDKAETPEEKNHKETMKEQKAALIEALHQKCKCVPLVATPPDGPPCTVLTSERCRLQPRSVRESLFVNATASACVWDCI